MLCCAWKGGKTLDFEFVSSFPLLSLSLFLIGFSVNLRSFAFGGFVRLVKTYMGSLCVYVCKCYMLLTMCVCRLEGFKREGS